MDKIKNGRLDQKWNLVMERDRVKRKQNFGLEG